MAKAIIGAGSERGPEIRYGRASRWGESAPTRLRLSPWGCLATLSFELGLHVRALRQAGRPFSFSNVLLCLRAIFPWLPPSWILRDEDTASVDPTQRSVHER